MSPKRIHQKFTSANSEYIKGVDSERSSCVTTRPLRRSRPSPCCWQVTDMIISFWRIMSQRYFAILSDDQILFLGLEMIKYIRVLFPPTVGDLLETLQVNYNQPDENQADKIIFCNHHNHHITIINWSDEKQADPDQRFTTFVKALQATRLDKEITDYDSE